MLTASAASQYKASARRIHAVSPSWFGGVVPVQAGRCRSYFKNTVSCWCHR